MNLQLAAVLESIARRRAQEARTELEAWVRAVLHRAAWERVRALTPRRP